MLQGLKYQGLYQEISGRDEYDSATNLCTNLRFVYGEYQLHFWSYLPKQDVDRHKRFRITKDDQSSGIYAECSLCVRNEG